MTGINFWQLIQYNKNCQICAYDSNIFPEFFGPLAKSIARERGAGWQAVLLWLPHAVQCDEYARTGWLAPSLASCHHPLHATWLISQKNDC